MQITVQSLMLLADDQPDDATLSLAVKRCILWFKTGDCYFLIVLNNISCFLSVYDARLGTSPTVCISSRWTEIVFCLNHLFQICAIDFWTPDFVSGSFWVQFLKSFRRGYAEAVRWQCCNLVPWPTTGDSSSYQDAKRSITATKQNYTGTWISIW